MSALPMGCPKPQTRRYIGPIGRATISLWPPAVCVPYSNSDKGTLASGGMSGMREAEEMRIMAKLIE